MTKHGQSRALPLRPIGGIVELPKTGQSRALPLRPIGGIVELPKIGQSRALPLRPIGGIVELPKIGQSRALPLRLIGGIAELPKTGQSRGASPTACLPICAQLWISFVFHYALFFLLRSQKFFKKFFYQHIVIQFYCRINIL